MATINIIPTPFRDEPFGLLDHMEYIENLAQFVIAEHPSTELPDWGAALQHLEEMLAQAEKTREEVTVVYAHKFTNFFRHYNETEFALIVERMADAPQLNQIRQAHNLTRCLAITSCAALGLLLPKFKEASAALRRAYETVVGMAATPELAQRLPLLVVRAINTNCAYVRQVLAQDEADLSKAEAKLREVQTDKAAQAMQRAFADLDKPVGERCTEMPEEHELNYQSVWDLAFWKYMSPGELKVLADLDRDYRLTCQLSEKLGRVKHVLMQSRGQLHEKQFAERIDACDNARAVELMLTQKQRRSVYASYRLELDWYLQRLQNAVQKLRASLALSRQAVKTMSSGHNLRSLGSCHQLMLGFSNCFMADALVDIVEKECSQMQTVLNEDAAAEKADEAFDETVLAMVGETSRRN